MSEAVVLGAGMVPFGKHRDTSLEELGRRAVTAALADAGAERADIEEVFCGNTHGGSLVGQRVLRELGISGPPITNFENACSSGSSALRQAVTAVRAGSADIVLVLGVEKLSALGGGTLPLDETDPEVRDGVVMPSVYAMRARRYMHEFGATPEDLARVAVKARKQAADNENAQFRTPVSVDEVLRSRMVSDPLTLFMCCPTGDGAAALVVGTRAAAERLGVMEPVTIAASVLQSGRYDVAPHDIAHSELTSRTGKLAYEEAGLGPQDVSLAEVHDAFAIAELMYYEALGFCDEGEGPRLLERGETESSGRIPVNPSGGLLARGHPVGATGVAQVCEAVWHLRGQAGARQVEDAKVALTHCTGGGISGMDHGACTIHVLTR